MKVFTFIATDQLGWREPLTITVKGAVSVAAARQRAHIKATCKGFDNDFTSLKFVATPFSVWLAA